MNSPHEQGAEDIYGFTHGRGFGDGGVVTSCRAAVLACPPTPATYSERS
jgi:hypothetical protein